MINIVIVGLSDNRKKILSDISKRCKIVGYADIRRKHKSFTTFDYVPYFDISKIDSSLCEYVIIAYTKKDDMYTAKYEIERTGFDSDKVIEYELFKETLCIDQMKIFSNTESNFDILLFGMSHSQCSIQPQYFHKSLFKFAAPSMDLFCQYKLIQRLITEHHESVRSVKKFILELPYYIFNFDLSRFRQFVLNRLYYFYLFSDYHHFGENEGDHNLITHFENFVKLFDRDDRSDKFTLNKDSDSEERSGIIHGIVVKAKRFILEILRKYKILHFKDDVWFKNYCTTQDENIEIWNNIVRSLGDVNPEAEIIILVCPFDPLFRKLYKHQIAAKKKQFYDIVNKIKNVKIIDNFTLNEHYQFTDHCHLKTESALRYTQIVKKQLED